MARTVELYITVCVQCLCAALERRDDDVDDGSEVA